MKTASLTEDNLTTPGVAIGTVAYMSPNKPEGRNSIPEPTCFPSGLLSTRSQLAGHPLRGTPPR